MSSPSAMSDLRFIESMVLNIIKAVPIIESQTSQLPLSPHGSQLASIENIQSRTISLKTQSQISETSENSIESYESGREPSELLALDSEYVKKHFGIPLTLALAEILTRRPSDPIHYLGHWLLKWRWNQEQKQLQEDRVLNLIADRERIAEDILEQERIAEEKKRIAAMELRAEAERIAQDVVDLLLKDLVLKDLPPKPIEVEPVTDIIDEDNVIVDNPDEEATVEHEGELEHTETNADPEAAGDNTLNVQENPN